MGASFQHSLVTDGDRELRALESLLAGAALECGRDIVELRAVRSRMERSLEEETRAFQAEWVANVGGREKERLFGGDRQIDLCMAQEVSKPRTPSLSH